MKIDWLDPEQIFTTMIKYEQPYVSFSGHGDIVFDEFTLPEWKKYKWVKIGINYKKRLLYFKPFQEKTNNCFEIIDGVIHNLDLIDEIVDFAITEDNYYPIPLVDIVFSHERYPAKWDKEKGVLVVDLKEPMLIDYDLAEIWQVLIEECKKGNIEAIKLYLKTKENYVEKVKDTERYSEKEEEKTGNAQVEQ